MAIEQQIEDIISKAQALLDTNDDYYIIINKTNRTIVITNNNNNTDLGRWSLNENSIRYGSYTFTQATALAKVFQDLYHIEYREQFGLRTTSGSNKTIKAF